MPLLGRLQSHCTLLQGCSLFGQALALLCQQPPLLRNTLIFERLPRLLNPVFLRRALSNKPDFLCRLRQ